MLVLAGCGSTDRPSAATVPATPAAAKPGSLEALRVGVVGRIRLDVPGVVAQRARLADVADAALVLVDARAASPAAVAAVARAHPLVHFAIVGASARAEHVPNFAGIVLEQDAAAYLAGVASGLAAAEEGGDTARVAWVGPEERQLAAAFGRGVHAAAPRVAVLHEWSRSVPARCKEAALTALSRNALVIASHGGLCADAAATAAHDRNVPALRLDDFLLPQVAAARVARDAAGGVFHGGEDVLFGPKTGAVGVGALDARVSMDVAARVRAVAQELSSPGGAGG